MCISLYYERQVVNYRYGISVNYMIIYWELSKLTMATIEWRIQLAHGCFRLEAAELRFMRIESELTRNYSNYLEVTCPRCPE